MLLRKAPALLTLALALFVLSAAPAQVAAEDGVPDSPAIVSTLLSWVSQAVGLVNAPEAGEALPRTASAVATDEPDSDDGDQSQGPQPVTNTTDDSAQSESGVFGDPNG